jgi:hypothetical protein
MKTVCPSVRRHFSHPPFAPKPKKQKTGFSAKKGAPSLSRGCEKSKQRFKVESRATLPIRQPAN